MACKNDLRSVAGPELLCEIMREGLHCALRAEVGTAYAYHHNGVDASCLPIVAYGLEFLNQGSFEGL